MSIIFPGDNYSFSNCSDGTVSRMLTLTVSLVGSDDLKHSRFDLNFCSQFIENKGCIFIEDIHLPRTCIVYTTESHNKTHLA